MPRPPYQYWGPRDWAFEVGKQLLDQLGHLLWSAGTTFLPFATLAVAYPAPQWVPLVAIAVLFAGVSGTAIVIREVEQGESRRPWDPWLDRTSFILGGAGGLYLGTWVVFAMHGS